MPAVGTCTLSQSRRGKFRKLFFDWTTHTDGTVSGTLTGPVEGIIRGLITNPGSPAPTDNYDITILNEDGFDILNGRGVDRDTANTEQVVPGIAFVDGVTTSIIPIVVDADTLEFKIANGGSAKQGRAILILE